MSCPFYGYAMTGATRDEHRRHFGAALIASGGNQCALITSAHSPCWMEVSEAREPSRPECPRNPEFFATQIARGAEGPNRKAMKRLEDAAVSLSYLRSVAAGFRCETHTVGECDGTGPACVRRLVDYS